MLSCELMAQSGSPSILQISFDLDSSVIEMNLDDAEIEGCHTTILLDSMYDLEYKTRVMRYFGGILKATTHEFEWIHFVYLDQTEVMSYSRKNVSKTIKRVREIYEQNNPVLTDLE